jgi:hypothetical protein
VRLYGERYQDAQVTGVFMNIYYHLEAGYDISDPSIPPHYKEKKEPISINYIFNVMEIELTGFLPKVKSLMYKQKRIPSHITSLKGITYHQKRPFIVADLETVVVDTVHIAYAAGYLVVNPGDDLKSLPPYRIQTYFSENTRFLYNNFKDRSQRMLFDFLYNLEICVKDNPKLRTVYFHNLSRFDGMFILNYYADRANRYIVKPLVRNNRIYEIKVYIGEKFLMRFRDSFTLLPRSLSSLGKTLCPELGDKGSIDHDSLVVLC